MLIRLTAPVAAVAVAEAGALVLLHRLGSYGLTAVEWGDLGRWLAETPPEDVLVALVRVTALALAWWLAASTILYALARAIRVPSLVGAVEWATLPAVRRLVDGVAVTTIAAGSVLGTSGIAAAAPADDTAVVVQLGPDSTSATTAPRYRPRPAGNGDVHPASSAVTAAPLSSPPPRRIDLPSTGTVKDPPSSVTAPTGPPTVGTAYVVQIGDNLWRIAERHLKDVTVKSEHDLADREVRRYWLRLIDHNRPRLLSGNPNLIYAGELIQPPLHDR